MPRHLHPPGKPGAAVGASRYRCEAGVTAVDDIQRRHRRGFCRRGVFVGPGRQRAAGEKTAFVTRFVPQGHTQRSTSRP
ncbi:hypothetical protein E2C01_027707 [Portunus trituberculatus]|uniref:Uncharacterized protein n=1 Tax=Portunus trituberculatus TaxID=210409 RepID=A0A5B7EMW5_PORTR|nr:hypothetical protein [Portunus trituberculatus]